MQIIRGTSRAAAPDLMPWAAKIVEIDVGPDGGTYLGFASWAEYEAWEAARLTR